MTNYTFNPNAEIWARQPDMQRGRWYPTVTQLADNRVVIADNRVVIASSTDETGSNAINNVIELFTPDPNIDVSARRMRYRCTIRQELTHRRF